MPSSWLYEADPIGSGRWNCCAEEQSRELNHALRRGVHKLDVQLGGTRYIVDLQSMTQTNARTGATRKLLMAASKIVYAYSGDRRGEWLPCDPEMCMSLAKAEQAGDLTVKLNVGAAAYEFNLKVMRQLNMATQASRRVRRVQCNIYAYEDGRPGSGHWKLCDDATCFALTLAASRGRRVLHHTIGTQEYKYDLLMRTQVNADTGMARRFKMIAAANGGSWFHCSRGCLGRLLLHARDGASSPGHSRLRRHALPLMLCTIGSFIAIVVAAIGVYTGVDSKYINQCESHSATSALSAESSSLLAFPALCSVPSAQPLTSPRPRWQIQARSPSSRVLCRPFSAPRRASSPRAARQAPTSCRWHSSRAV